MIKIKRPKARDVLRKETRAYLRWKQQAANGYAPGSADIQRVWKSFLGTRHAKDDVARALHECCRGKCAYCEILVPKDIEHFYPKSMYPRKMFRWTNFLRGCKNCNQAKRDQFPKRGNRRLLIDPCSDEPLDYFYFDRLTGKVALNPDPAYHERAETTRDMFDLDGGAFCDERRMKLNNVLMLLGQVVGQNPVSNETVTLLESELLPTRPWLGIVRQLFKNPGVYAELVTQARNKLPIIDRWIADYL